MRETLNILDIYVIMGFKKVVVKILNQKTKKKALIKYEIINVVTQGIHQYMLAIRYNTYNFLLVMMYKTKKLIKNIQLNLGSFA